MPRTPKQSSQQDPPQSEPSPFQREVLECLEKVKQSRNDQMDQQQLVAQLKSMHEHLLKVKFMCREHRIELLQEVQRIVGGCEESNQHSESILQCSELLIITLDQIPCDLPTATDKHSPKSARPVEDVPTLKSCRRLLDNIVCALKQKWKCERQSGYPALKAGGKSSASGKKLAKSMPKYETYIVKVLWARWSSFEKKTERVRDEKELLKVLHGTQAFFQRVLDTLQTDQQAAKVKTKANAQRNIRTPNTTNVTSIGEVMESKKVDEIPVDTLPIVEPLASTIEPVRLTDIFLSSTYKVESVPDMLQVSRPSSGDGLLCMTVFEPPHPTTSIASAQATTKYFRDSSMIGMRQVSKPTSKQRSHSSQLRVLPSLLGNPKWLPIKHSLAAKGVLMANGLHISLPVHRAEFLIGRGNLGHVEFALAGDFQPIALKRLTQYGRVDPGRCDGIRRSLEECAASVKAAARHLLVSLAMQDMCGYSFSYAPLCDYNLGEYVALLLGSNAEPVLEAAQVLAIMRQVVHGLGALHLAKNPIVHGNLKPANVMVTAGGLVKLADFGISKYLYDQPEDICPQDKIWWADEIHTWLQKLNKYSCSTMSDIYSCGMLFLYVFSGGCLPSIEHTFTPLETLEQEKPSMGLELFHLVEQMLHSDPVQRPAIIEVHNHIYFWPHRQRSVFLNTCISVANADFAPFFVERQVAHGFCTTLDQIWGKDGTKLFWLPAAQLHYAHITAPFGVATDSALGLLQFLAKCRHDDAELFNRVGLMARAYPQLACVVYNALRTTNWFEHEKFRAFSPSQEWSPSASDGKTTATDDDDENAADDPSAVDDEV